jgi:hypothetical protein
MALPANCPCEKLWRLGDSAPDAKVLQGCIGQSVKRLLTFLLVSICGGCGSWFHPAQLNAPPAQPIANPALLPPLEDQFVWLQVVDVIDDYFRVIREQPAINHGGVQLEGRLDTAYRIGSGIFEPWRGDSTPGFERLQSTLQSIRRRATVSIRPRSAGYEMELIVLKELEDVNRSQHGGASAATQRHDGTVVRTDDSTNDEQTTLGWIPQGRDMSLEQVMLHDIIGRLTGPEQKKLLHPGYDKHGR